MGVIRSTVLNFTQYEAGIDGLGCLTSLIASEGVEKEVAGRNPKLFYVSTKATTTTIQTSSMCFMTKDAIKLCKKRKKRSINVEPSEGVHVGINPASVISKIQEQDIEEGTDDQFEVDTKDSTEQRQGKYLLYWMTTTSVSSLISYTKTVTIASLYCTPNDFPLSECAK